MSMTIPLIFHQNRFSEVGPTVRVPSLGDRLGLMGDTWPVSPRVMRQLLDRLP
jgi:hypothetical protein